MVPPPLQTRPRTGLRAFPCSSPWSPREGAPGDQAPSHNEATQPTTAARRRISLICVVAKPWNSKRQLVRNVGYFSWWRLAGRCITYGPSGWMFCARFARAEASRRHGIIAYSGARCLSTGMAGEKGSTRPTSLRPGDTRAARFVPGAACQTDGKCSPHRSHRRQRAPWRPGRYQNPGCVRGRRGASVRGGVHRDRGGTVWL